MKTITKKVKIQKIKTIFTMDDGIHCAPKCNHFIISCYCALRVALYEGEMEKLESTERKLCLRTEFCIEIFGDKE